MTHEPPPVNWVERLAADEPEGLQIRQDAAFQRFEWLVQRLLKIVFLALLLAALLGAFGDGPLSQATVSSSDRRLSVSYERFCRSSAPLLLTLTHQVNPRDADGFEIWLSAAYLKKMRVCDIVPLPNETVFRGEWIGFAYDKKPNDGGENEVQTIRVYLEPKCFGSVTGQARTSSGDAVRFGHFVYP